MDGELPAVVSWRYSATRGGSRDRLWSLPGGANTASLEGHSHVYSVAFSPDGKSIASACSGGQVKPWVVATGKNTRTLKAATHFAWCVAFSPDGKFLASSSEDGTVEVWDASGGKLIGTLTGHAARVSSVCFTHDGKALVTGSSDKTIRLWAFPVLAKAGR